MVNRKEDGHPTDNGIAGLVSLLTSERHFIVRTTLGCTIVATVTAFLITPQFKSSTSVFPAEKAELPGGFEGVSSLVSSISSSSPLGALTGDDELNRYVAILNSGTVLSSVIRKFNLVNVYDITDYPKENTAKELLSNVDFSIETEGQLVITVYDEDPQRAADMANFFVEELNRTNSQIQGQNARGNMTFIAERYQRNLDDLRAAEESLRVFQKQHGILALPEQLEESIRAGSELSATLAAREVELAVKIRTLSADHPSVTATRVEVEELRKKLEEMGRLSGKKDNSVNLIVPFNEMPDLGTEYLRRYRDLEIQSGILRFLTPIYEQARVEENRNTPSVVVLDRAGPAERKARPKRAVIMIIGMTIGFFGSVGYAAAKKRWNDEKAKGSPFFVSASAFIDSVSIDVQTVRSRIRKKDRG